MNISSMISLKSDPLVKVVYHQTQSHCFHNYRQVSNIKRTFVDNKIVDHSDVANRRCSSYIFILDWTPGFTWLGKDNCKTRP